MGILDKLFGKQNPSNLRDDPSQRDDMIRMYDKEGNEYFISKSEYRNNVLPDAFEKTMDNPDGLYSAIVMTLQDGFFEHCLLPAKRLAQIDPNKERSATILGIVLMKNNQLDEAQIVLDNYLEQYGDSGVILTNLAKVFAEKGQDEKSIGTLRKALTVNPNQDNALEWWCVIHREKEGEEGFYRAMEEVAQIPGSWRPQLWLARRLLEQKKISSAIAIYRRVLESDSETEDALMMISGDLGNNGYLIQMLDLVLPFYNAEKHGALAGLNLIKSCIRLGEKETGLRLCDSVDRLQRYDLKQYTEQLRTELEKL